MEYLEIYNRQSNIWTRHTLKAGFAENWVLDKTTDTAANIEFRVDGATMPAYDINDWARILHISTALETATYTAAGLPLNHTQYIISGVTFERVEVSNYWRVSLTLAEPIERFKGVAGEVLTYTNQISKAVYNPDTETTTTYTHDAYNHESALDRWLKLTPANCDDYDSGYNKTANIGWYNRITIPATDRAFLAAIPFGDQTINGRNLFEVLMDIYDSSTGRTPVAYFDINSATDKPRNVARDEYILKFERQDGYDKDELQLEDLTDGAARVVYTKSIANYATGLIGDIENMATDEDIEYPAQRLYVVPEVDSNIRVTTDKSANTSDDWILRTPFAIKKVLKIEKLTASAVYDSGMPEAWTTITTTTEETANCFEEKEYDALTPDPDTNKNYIKYKEGERYITVRGYRYFDETVIDLYEYPNGILYYIEYQPLLNPRVIVGDTEYCEAINQTDGQAESAKQADFMTQYLAGMNKADIVINKTNKSYSDFENFIGSRVIDGDKVYLVTAQSYKNRNYQYDVFLQLNENHFRKNDSYQAAKEIQKNIAIGYENIKERKCAIKEVINLGLTAQTNSFNLFSFNKTVAVSALAPGKVTAEKYPQIALLKCKSTLTSESLPDEDYTIYRVAPLAKYAFDNQMHLHYKFYDNAVAGKSKEADAVNEPYGDLGGNLLRSVTRISAQLPVLYTDYFGEIERITAYLANVNEVDVSAITDYTEAAYNTLVEFYQRMLNFPAVSPAQQAALIARSVVTVADRLLLKDQLEQLNENYIIELNSSDFIICPLLPKLSRLMRPTDAHELKLLLLNTKKSKKEHILTAEIMYNKSILKANTTLGANYVEYEFEAVTETDYKCAVLATDNNEPLIIINNVANVIDAIAAGKLKIYI